MSHTNVIASAAGDYISAFPPSQDVGTEVELGLIVVEITASFGDAITILKFGGQIMDTQELNFNCHN
ncbi:hypothetical protein OAN307_c41180 [Octadecabacter antarcticus 307]|uniref:Uncharacterized protein n=1 Tax=Octadecabacter antarcticus 307 TaxID=391626 RepID=M9RBH6_9RHOB|nr:hypothetical protein [Octadecabacter antarcticus]AGI69517.1 hypothetical protein OAN307_c41180 [Octadecabacter antarcticus 307]